MNALRAVCLLSALSCGRGTTMPPSPPDDRYPVSFSMEVMPILQTKCTGCHQGQYDQASTTFTRLRLSTSATAACASTPRILENDGANSLLVKKLLGTAGCGSVMPLMKTATTQTVPCTDSQCVAAEDIQLIKLWIDQGATNN